MTRVLYLVKSRLPLCRDVMLCRENSVYLSSVELESEIFPPSWMELLFRFYLHENTETLPNNKDMDASALNDCLLRKIKNQPKPHRALKVSLITQDVTSMASSYSHLFRLGNFPEWSPLLYPLPISKLFLEKNLSATGTNNCIIFALSIIFAFEVMMEIMLAWILTLFIPTSRTLIRSQVLTWLTPFGEIGQWSDSFTESVCRRAIKLHCRSDNDSFLFPWKQPDQSIAPLHKVSPSQQKFCCPRIFVIQVLSSSSLNWEKLRPGQKRHS